MKFNVLNRKKNQVTRNHQGGLAYKMAPKMELYTAVVTASLSNKIYETDKERLKRIIQLIKKVDHYFVAQLAIYTREAMYLRSIPIVLVVELSKIHNGDSLIKNTVARVVKRADEITELLAYYQLSNQRTGEKKLNKLSKQIQKGLSIAFNNFDEYQFAKYNRNTAVTLKDALFLTHPKANSDAQQLLFNKIAKDTLEVPYTWEVELSKVGQLSFRSPEKKAKAFTRKWEELIDSKRLGYMATMRNLRNILQANVSGQHIKKIGALLSDPTQVRKSKQLPFRFLAAYRELEIFQSSYASYLMDCLEKAVQVSVENIKGFGIDTKVVLAADVSGSMYSPVSAKSKIRCFDIGLVLSMLMRSKSDNVITGIFGDTWKTVNLPKNNILGNALALNRIEGSVGYSTNGFRVIQDFNKRREVVDKIMIFTDVQLWDSTHVGNSLKNEWDKYKSNVAPKAKLYIFDLQGHGHSPIKIAQRDVFQIAGWSDKIFNVLDAIERGKTVLRVIKTY